MATRTFNGVINHTTDAGFRAWVAELISEMIAVGLVQTADTGQIDTATVARPGTSTEAGYAIFRLPDSSLYAKFGFGTSGSATVPAIWLTIGTGSNGSGTITGAAISTRSLIGPSAGPSSTSTIYTSYVCLTAHSFSLCWKSNANGSKPQGGCVFGWPLAADGSRITKGFGVFTQPNNVALLQSVRLDAPATAYGSTNAYCLVVGSVSSSLKPNGDFQVYPWYLNLPEATPFIWGLTYVNAEITRLNTVTARLYGPVDHTYLAEGQVSNVSAGTDATGSVAYQPAIIFE